MLVGVAEQCISGCGYCFRFVKVSILFHRDLIVDVHYITQTFYRSICRCLLSIMKTQTVQKRLVKFKEEHKGKFPCLAVPRKSKTFAFCKPCRTDLNIVLCIVNRAGRV